MTVIVLQYAELKKNMIVKFMYVWRSKGELISDILFMNPFILAVPVLAKQQELTATALHRHRM